MSQKYILVQRSDMSQGAPEGSKKYYAQAVSSGYMTFDELCEEIAEASALTSADVKAMMDRMVYLLRKELLAGRIVQFGEIGSFRLSLGSSGADTPKEFTNLLIKKPKIQFTPGQKLREVPRLVTFERQSPATPTAPGGDDGGGGGDDDKPVVG